MMDSPMAQKVFIQSQALLKGAIFIKGYSGEKNWKSHSNNRIISSIIK